MMKNKDWESITKVQLISGVGSFSCLSIGTKNNGPHFNVSFDRRAHACYSVLTPWFVGFRLG